ncbi:trehalase-like domain-containing protein, partial [Microbispora siamensis]|uniref:trehalase-like domain-containing protein n=1 Tax=Microbispora siamensis TaxID=564413 RepID=UPI001EF21AF0
MRIEDYALIGDTQSAALIGMDGSIDWLCLPRFDSPSCFARLLGDEHNGFWRLAAAGRDRAARRAYVEDSLVLATDWETSTGTARVVDFMPVRSGNPDLVRMVEGLSGTVEMTMEIRIRFDYGRIVPWARRAGGHLHAIGGPDSVWIHSPVPLRGGDYRHEATFRVAAGQRLPFVFTWNPSHQPQPQAIDPFAELGLTIRMWQDWAARCGYRGRWRDAVVRS